MDMIVCGLLIFIWFGIGQIGITLEQMGVIGFENITYDTSEQQQSEEADDSMFYTSMWLSMESD